MTKLTTKEFLEYMIKEHGKGEQALRRRKDYLEIPNGFKWEEDQQCIWYKTGSYGSEARLFIARYWVEEERISWWNKETRKTHNYRKAPGYLISLSEEIPSFTFVWRGVQSPDQYDSIEEAAAALIDVFEQEGRPYRGKSKSWEAGLDDIAPEMCAVIRRENSKIA